MAGLGVSRNDSPICFFVQCAQCSWTCSVLVCKCASGRLCHLEKIAFWAIIEGPFAGYAFRGVNSCCIGFGFWGKKIAHRRMVDSQTPKQRYLPRTIIFRSNQPGFLAEVKGTFPSILACLCVCLIGCRSICLQ